MAIRTYQIELNDIKNQRYNRFDVRYYAVIDFYGGLVRTNKAKLVPLKDLVSRIKSGSYIDRYESKDSGIPYLRVGNIKPFSLNENEADFVYVASDVDEKIRVLKNDILLARTQATYDKLGTACIMDACNENWATSQHITRIRVDEKKISPYYLVAYLNSKFFKAQTPLASHGSTRVEFTHSQLGEAYIFIPEKDLYESVIHSVKKIIEYNRVANNLIGEAKEIFRQATSLNSVKTEQLYFEMNLYGLTEFDIWNATCHTPSLADAENKLKANFKTISLPDVTDISKGDEVGSDNYDVYIKKSSTDYAFCRTSDIINYEIDLFPDYFVSKRIYDSMNQDIQPYDILFTKDGKIGQVALVTEVDKAVISSGVARIRVKNNDYHITPEYLFTVLSMRETGYNPAIRRTVATTVPHLRPDRLKQIAIPILSGCVIDEISQKIDSAFKLKSERKRLINIVLDEINSKYDYLYKALYA